MADKKKQTKKLPPWLMEKETEEAPSNGKPKSKAKKKQPARKY